jgi:hypothetical protein
MRIQYESTIEEAVESSFRLADMAGMVRKGMWRAALNGPLFVLGFICLLPLDYWHRVAAGAVAAMILIPYHLFTYERRLRKGIRQTVVKERPRDWPIPSEYEMDEEGITFRREGMTLAFTWACVTQFNETRDAIEIVTRPRGLMRIPRRIFANTPEELEWAAFLREHAALALVDKPHQPAGAR